MKYRCSLSVISFNEKIKSVWKLDEWSGIKDEDQDVLFFGLYTMHDWDAFWYHQGKKTIFWCGSDILNTLATPEFQRRLKIFPDTEHYCETEEEAKNLRSMGIEPKIVPSFLENADEFPVVYEPSLTPHVWMCAHSGREEEYGVDILQRMADKFPDYTFHIYGIWEYGEKQKNVIFHGQVSNDILNQEIRQYHCGFRGNLHEGFSEVPIKSLLLGQYPIARMKFPEIWNFQNDDELIALLGKLKEQKDINIEGMRYWKRHINHFPWC